jgi:serine/threonine protein kinase
MGQQVSSARALYSACIHELQSRTNNSDRDNDDSRSCSWQDNLKEAVLDPQNYEHLRLMLTSLHSTQVQHLVKALENPLRWVYVVPKGSPIVTTTHMLNNSLTTHDDCSIEHSTDMKETVPRDTVSHQHDESESDEAHSQRSEDDGVNTLLTVDTGDSRGPVDDRDSTSTSIHQLHTDESSIVATATAAVYNDELHSEERHASAIAALQLANNLKSKLTGIDMFGHQTRSELEQQQHTSVNMIDSHVSRHMQRSKLPTVDVHSPASLGGDAFIPFLLNVFFQTTESHDDATTTTELDSLPSADTNAQPRARTPLPSPSPSSHGASVIGRSRLSRSRSESIGMYAASPERQISADSAIPDASSSATSHSEYRPLHLNLPTIVRVIQSDTAWFVVIKRRRDSIQSLLRFESDLTSSDEAKLFVIYQLLHVLSFCHTRGIVHGALSPDTCLLSPNLWLTLVEFHCSVNDTQQQHYAKTCTQRDDRIQSIRPPPALLSTRAAIESIHNTTDYRDALVTQWIHGNISNFDYIMELNRLVGREQGNENPAYHPVLPWVVDFTSPDSGWRDLTKTKFRMRKGDEQLDFTFRSAIDPHHITENLSELTYHVYMARRLPLADLKRVVRAKFVPDEYPSSMDRIYRWTPDECIPEFYMDPTVFDSTHKNLGLVDLNVPEWCDSTEEFIRWHRAALESDSVSRNLHHWIDLNFGYKLSGPAAIEAKNVALKLPAPVRGVGGVLKSLRVGFVQLFDKPHPPRDALHAVNSETRRTANRTRAAVMPKTPLLAPSQALDIAFLQSSADMSTRKSESQSQDMSEFKFRNDMETTDVPRSSTAQTLLPLHLLQSVAGFSSLYSFVEGAYQPHSSDTGPGVQRSCSKHMSTLERLVANDMFAVGCIIAELYLPQPLFNRRTMTQYLRGEYQPPIHLLPLRVQPIVKSLLSLNASKRLQADDVLRSSLFPQQLAFDDVYEFVDALLRPWSTDFSTPLFPLEHESLSTDSDHDDIDNQRSPTSPTTPTGTQDDLSMPELPQHQPRYGVEAYAASRLATIKQLRNAFPPELVNQMDHMRLEWATQQLQQSLTTLPNRVFVLIVPFCLQIVVASGIRIPMHRHGVITSDDGKNQFPKSTASADSVSAPSSAVSSAASPSANSLAVPMDSGADDTEYGNTEDYIKDANHCIPPILFRFFDILGAKLGVSLSMTYLEPTLTVLLQRKSDSYADELLQLQLLQLDTMHMIRRTFHSRYFELEYMSFARAALSFPCASVREAAIDLLIYCGLSFEPEITITQVFLPLFANLRSVDSRSHIVVLATLVQHIGDSLFMHVVFPNTMLLLQPYRSVPNSEPLEAEDVSRQVLAGLNVLAQSLSRLSPATCEHLLLESFTLRQLLIAPQEPISAACVRQLIHIIMQLCIEVGMKEVSDAREAQQFDELLAQVEATGFISSASATPVSTPSKADATSAAGSSSQRKSAHSAFATPTNRKNGKRNRRTGFESGADTTPRSGGSASAATGRGGSHGVPDRALSPLSPLGDEMGPPLIIDEVIPYLTEFLHGMLQRLEQETSNRFPYEIQESKEFIHMVYVPLCQMIGQRKVQARVRHSDKIEDVIMSLATPDTHRNKSRRSRNKLHENNTGGTRVETSPGGSSLRVHTGADTDSKPITCAVAPYEDQFTGSNTGGFILNSLSNSRYDVRATAICQVLPSSSHNGSTNSASSSLQNFADAPSSSDVLAAYVASEDRAFHGDRKTTDDGTVSNMSYDGDSSTPAPRAKRSLFDRLSDRISNRKTAPSPTPTPPPQIRETHFARPASSTLVDLSEFATFSNTKWLRQVTMAPTNAPGVAGSIAGAAGQSTWQLRAEARCAVAAHTSAVTTLAPHPDHGMFASGSRDGSIKLWGVDVHSNSVSNRLTYSDHADGVHCVRFLNSMGMSRDWVASSATTGPVHIWDVNHGKLVRRFSSGTWEEASGNLLLAPRISAYANSLRSWSDSNFGASIAGSAGTGGIGSVPSSARGDSDMWSDQKRSTPPLTPASKMRRVSAVVGTASAAAAAAAAVAAATADSSTTTPSKDGRNVLQDSSAYAKHSLVSCFEHLPHRHAIIIGTVDAEQVSSAFKQQRSESVAVVSNNGAATSSGSHGSGMSAQVSGVGAGADIRLGSGTYSTMTVPCVRLFDLNSGKVMRNWHHPMTNGSARIQSIVVAQDGDWVATGLTNGYVCVFDERTGMVNLWWRAHEGGIVDMACFGRDSLVTSGSDHRVHLWKINCAAPKLIRSFERQKDVVLSLTVHRHDFLCTVGHQLGIASLRDELPQGPDSNVSRINLTAVRGNKARQAFTSTTSLQPYGFLLLGTNDGRILIC